MFTFTCTDLGQPQGEKTTLSKHCSTQQIHHFTGNQQCLRGRTIRLMKVSPTSAPAGSWGARQNYPRDEDHKEKGQKAVWVLLHHYLCCWASEVTICCDLKELRGLTTRVRDRYERLSLSFTSLTEWIFGSRLTLVCAAAARVRLEVSGVAGLLLWAGGSQD